MTQTGDGGGGGGRGQGGKVDCLTENNFLSGGVRVGRFPWRFPSNG